MMLVNNSGDITNPKLLWLKAALFVLIGLLCAVLLLLDMPHWQDAVFFVLAVWAFCRAYYFTFYVIRNYIDPAFKFSGLLAVGRYLLSSKRNK